MATSPDTGQLLTVSSDHALDWAAWFAASRELRSRPEHVVPSKSAGPPTGADSVDLLLGILFANPAASEPLALLEHFGIPLGQLNHALPEDRRVDPATLPSGAPPPRTEMQLWSLGDVLARAADLATQSGAVEQRTRPADLFGALIQAPDDPAAALLDRLLEEHGVSERAFELGNEYPQYLAGQPSLAYADFLARAHPWAGRAQSIADYDADAVRPATEGADAATDAQAAPRDFVGIGPEVDAFAYLLASRALIPPLAIGLFGDWGSGKSFFMQALQRRVDRVTEWARRQGRPQRDLPIHKSVVQIQFNAWHYVEGNLWASLVEHIFSNLRLSPTERPDQLAQRRQHVTEKIASAELARSQVVAAIAAEESRLGQAQRDREQLEADQRAVRDDLAQAATSAAREVEDYLKSRKITDTLERLGYPPTGASVAEFATAISEARAVLQRGTGIARRLQGDGWPWALAILVVIAVGPLASVVLTAANVPSVTNVLGSVAAALGGATVLLKNGTQWTSERLGELEQAEQKVLQKQRALDAAKVDADQQIELIQARLDAKHDEEKALAVRILDLNRELQAITPAKVLSDFIDARIGSDDYRKHLGLTAIVRRDFEDLWHLIAREEKAFLESDTGANRDTPREISRIVLYIDDLDRCPPRVVVNVLQAIHLLLAFPLFVVVVAVDARWLSSSLERQYGELLRRPGFPGDPTRATNPSPSTDQATPDDYLEKIFQVPFWVRPLDSDSRGRIVQGLIAPSLTTEAVTEGGSTNVAPAPATPADPAVVELARRFQADDEHEPSLRSLEITTGEATFMQSLSPLLGDSPRAVKRFVNVYRLMKSLTETADPAFMATVPRAGHKLVLFLLAIVTGMPGISVELFRSIERPQPDRGTLAQFAGAAAGEHPEDAAILSAWLAEAEDGMWGTVALADLLRWSAQIARFSFRTEVA